MLHRLFSILIVACSCVGLACSSGIAHRDGGNPDTSLAGGDMSRADAGGGGVADGAAGGSAVGVADGAAGGSAGGVADGAAGGSAGGVADGAAGGAGGVISGVDARLGGIAGGATGGQRTSGTGAGSPPKILWTDSIQTKPSPWGFDGLGIEHPIGPGVTASDANGVNLSVVPDPLGGPGLAMRHFATFDTGGSRAQAGIYGDINTAFGAQAKKPEGVWIAQEWYFPEALNAKGEPYCWLNLWDFHAVAPGRSVRWATAPGIMLARDGSMKVTFEWGTSVNKGSALSTLALPVGRWFDIEMHYVWTDTPTGTISLWIDGQLALEQTGVQTKGPEHQIVETYAKFYGSTQGRGAWTPTPSLKYTRNLRIAGERIWR